MQELEKNNPERSVRAGGGGGRMSAMAGKFGYIQAGQSG